MQRKNETNIQPTSKHVWSFIKDYYIVWTAVFLWVTKARNPEWVISRPILLARLADQNTGYDLFSRLAEQAMNKPCINSISCPETNRILNRPIRTMQRFITNNTNWRVGRNCVKTANDCTYTVCSAVFSQQEEPTVDTQL